MTYAELAEAATRLPTEERLRLLEAIARSLREEGSRPEQPADDTRGRFDPSRSALDQLRGIARPVGPPPTDDDIKGLIAGNLIHDHAR